jgi:hypothetical protein
MKLIIMDMINSILEDKNIIYRIISQDNKSY